MNKKDKKKQKKASVPHGFRKTILSKSNSSLSQSLHVASYKKRINDLSKNNRLLAVALQESRIEAAFQTNLLKDFTRDSQNIMFARLKMNEMAKTMAKFVADLEEVRTYLKTDALNRYNAFQKDRTPNARLIKAPRENVIEEVSEESEIIEVHKNNSLDMPIISKPKGDNSDDVQNLAARCSTTPPIDVEMAPILFVDDGAVKNKKSSSRSKRSAASSDAEKGSLTPKLDIDLTCYKSKRSSSRRMTQFIFPEVRSTKSGGKDESPKKSFEELATPVMPESPPVLNYKQNPDEVSKSPFIENIQQSRSKLTVISSQSIPVDNKADINSPTDDVTMVLPVKMGTAPTVIQPADSNSTVLICEDMELTDVIRPAFQMIVHSELPAIEETAGDPEIGVNVSEKSEKLYLNNKAKCESEPLKQSGCSQNDSVVVDKKVDSNKDVNTSNDYSPRRSVTEDKDKVTCEEKTPKLSDFLQNNSVIPNDCVQSQMKDIEFDEEIQNVGELTFCDTDEQAHQKESTENQSLKVDTFSPVRRSRPKKSIKYTVFFSSDEEETPPAKKKNSETKKFFTARNQKSSGKSEVAPAIHKNEATSKARDKNQNNDPSVYNLDVSNSEKPVKKKYLQTSRASKNRKASSKELPKSLFEHCSVTKMKAGDYKFSKKEGTPKKMKVIQEQLKEQSPLVVKSCISPCGILKKNQPDACPNKAPPKTKPAFIFSDSTDDSVQIKSPAKDTTHRYVLETPKSESKRVSFANTDIVCNFRRMSVSKKIADNKKERRTSKSALDFFKKADLPEAEFHVNTDVPSESTSPKNAEPAALFNMSSDETELYHFPVPLSSQLPALPVKRPCSPSKIEIPSIDETEVHTGSIENNPQTVKAAVTVKSPKQTEKLSPSKIKLPTTDATEVSVDNVENHEIIKKAVITVKSPKPTGKLSLKRNKITQNSEISGSSTTTRDQINVLPLESPKSKVTKTKRKSLFKEILIENSKENMVLFSKISGKQEEAVESIPCVDENLHLPLKEQNKKSSSYKKQRPSKASTKSSTKRKNLSDKLNVNQPSSGVNNNPGTRSVESSPVLKDALNTTISDDAILPKRRSKLVSYKEPNLNKKLRRV